MAKQTKSAATVAAEPTTGESARKTTDKTFESLFPTDEIVVEVGPRQRVQNNKVVTVEEAREVVFTKAGYSLMDRDDDGETIHIPTKVVGIPSYEDITDPTVAGGKRKEMVTLYFEQPVTAAEAAPESDEDEDQD